MVNIKYSQEKVNKLFYVVPGAFVLFGALFLFLLLGSKDSEGNGPGLFILMPVIMLAIGVWFFRSTLKKAKEAQREILEIKEKGRQLDGEILRIDEHRYVSHDSHGRHTTYYYNFVVNYQDPDTLEQVTAESVTTYERYELQSPFCKLRLYEGKVLVEQADVTFQKSRKYLPFLIFAILLIVGNLLRIKGCI